MGEAARVYTEQLQRFDCGHALWWPEHRKGPDGQERAVEIGDVGYIDKDGAFHPLFNVTYPANDPRNAGRVPDNDVTPLEFNADSIDIKNEFLPVGPLHSSSVTSRRMGANISADDQVTQTVGVALAYTFECQNNAGAVLMLWDDATKTTVEEGSRLFEDYMIHYHASWYEYARNKRGLSIKSEDLILVRGFVKTSRWTIAVFLGNTSQRYEVTIHGKLGPFASVDVNYSTCEESRCSSISPRSGPSHRIKTEELSVSPSFMPWTSAVGESSDTRSKKSDFTKDQCVFLNYYKVKRRKLLPDRLKAAAGQSEKRPRDQDGDSTFAIHVVDDAEVKTESSGQYPYYTPLDKILDYILEFSDATLAIASYNDIEGLLQVVDEQWPITLDDLIRRALLQIDVDEQRVGRLAGLSEGASHAAPDRNLTKTSLPGLGSTAHMPPADHANSMNRSTHRGKKHKVRERSMTNDSSMSISTMSGLQSQDTLNSASGSNRFERLTDQPKAISPVANHSDTGITFSSTQLHQPRWHTFANPDFAYAAGCGPGMLIPQKVYQGSASYTPLPTLRFSCGGVPGVRVVDAEPGVIRNLDNRTFRPLFNLKGNRIVIRILWPGYMKYAVSHAFVKHHTPTVDGLTMEELTGAVASLIREFYTNMRNTACTEPNWNLQKINIDKLHLLELHNVSSNAWQPVLMYRS